MMSRHCSNVAITSSFGGCSCPGLLLNEDGGAAASSNSAGPSAKLYLRDLGCVTAVLPALILMRRLPVAAVPAVLMVVVLGRLPVAAVMAVVLGRRLVAVVTAARRSSVSGVMAMPGLPLATVTPPVLMVAVTMHRSMRIVPAVVVLTAVVLVVGAAAAAVVAALLWSRGHRRSSRGVRAILVPAQVNPRGHERRRSFHDLPLYGPLEHCPVVAPDGDQTLAVRREPEATRKNRATHQQRKQKQKQKQPGNEDK